MARIAARIAPERAAQEAARRRFANFALDANNFSHPDQLATLLAPYRMVSFDLFDTLIWREVALEDVARKTADFANRYICGDDGPLPHNLLLHARGRHQEAIKSVGMASTQAYRNEADLSDVFDSALIPYIADATRRARAVETLLAFEIETERHVLTVDPVMRDFLIQLRMQGKLLILISDMYFSERWLRQLLEQLGILQLFDHVFVSATVGVTKHSGKLFDHVDDVLGSADWRRIHLGDNWNNDVVQPRKHGWDALHYLNVDNEMRKHRLEQLSNLDAHSRPAAAQTLMQQIRAGDQVEELMRLVSAGFLSFARQVLTTAQQGRYDRIVFLTRDGTIYRHMIRQLVIDSGTHEALDLPQMDDLAFSRRTGVLLTCPPLSDPEWEGYIRHHIGWMQQQGASLGSLMRTFALTPDDMAGLRGLDKWVDAHLEGRPDCDVDFSAIMAQPELAEAVDAALQAKRQRIVDYLDQQRLFLPDQRILLVDIGYSGTVLKSLSEHMYLMEAEGQRLGTRMTMVMFAANRFFNGNLNKMHPRVTMLDPVMISREDWRDRAAAYNFAWLEPFAVDRTRGSLLDFQPDAQGLMQPVFAPAGLYRGPVTRERILATARDIDQLLRRSSISSSDAETAIRRTISDCFARPKRSTLQGVSGLTHHSGLTDVVEGGLLSRIRPWRLRSDLAQCVHEDRWLQGSMAASRLGWLNPLLNRLIGIKTR